MEYQDYYAALGVPKTASDNEIRSAFRKLARQHHPDVNPNNADAEAKFKTINEAYQVLSDPEKRKEYDALGERWKAYQSQQSAGGQPFDWESFMGGRGQQTGYRTVSEDDLRDMFGGGQAYSDFFTNIFGGGARASGPRGGADVQGEVEITLAEAYTGTKRTVTFTNPDGTTRRLEVTIPAGIQDGGRVRVSGQGAPGRGGGPAGDLYLIVQLLPDDRFQVDGADLRVTTRATLAAMLRGGEVKVPTPDGRTLALKIPAGCADGRVFRLRGQGMTRGKGKGDILAEVHVAIPESLTAAQREKLQAFADSLEEAGVGGTR